MTVKFKVEELPILSLFKRHNSSKASRKRENDAESVFASSEEKNFSKEAMQRHPRKFKSLYVHVSKRHERVAIVPEVTSKRKCRETMLAYDGKKSVFAARALPFESKEFVVKIAENNGREREFKVTIKFAAIKDLHHLRQLLSGRQCDCPLQTIQTLDVVLRESTSQGREIVGRSLFSHEFGQGPLVMVSSSGVMEGWRESFLLSSRSHGTIRGINKSGTKSEDSSLQSQIKDALSCCPYSATVHVKFELMPGSLYLTINIVDRYLSQKPVPRREL